MEPIIFAGLLGGLGGLTRGIVGLLKAFSIKRRILKVSFLSSVQIDTLLFTINSLPT